MPMKTNKNSVDMDNSLVVNRRKGRKEKLGKGYLLDPSSDRGQ